MSSVWHRLTLGQPDPAGTARLAKVDARAVLIDEAGGELRDATVVLPPPGPGQVVVRIAAAGVCHSDLSLSSGALGQPLPAVLGHEASGVIIEVGSQVNWLWAGQPVVLNWSPACGSCWFCGHAERHLCEHAADAAARPYATLPSGQPVYAGLGTAAFAEATVLDATAVVPLPDGMDLATGAILGCAVLTGVGAVRKTAGVRPGSSVAVVGLGGVGLAAVQGARLAGADPIIAIDAVAGKAELAKSCGATKFTTPDTAREVVREATGGRGADEVFECVGRAATIRAAWDLARRGGGVTVVGVGRRDDPVSFSALELFYLARTLRGCVYGSADPAIDLPELARNVADGSLSVAALVTDRAPASAAAVREAFERMARGQGGRTLLTYHPEGGSDANDHSA